MQPRFFIFALALVAALAGFASAPVAADGGRPAAEPGASADALPRPADEALRGAMTALRDTLEQRIHQAEPLAEADYVALAAEIERQVAAIVAGRDFHSRSGRHLQWLLGDITDAAGLMRSAPRAPAKKLGLMRAVETLNFYGREYDHPGWVVLKY